MHLVIGTLGSCDLVVPLASCQRAIVSILAAILLFCFLLKMLLEFLLEVIVAISVVLFWFLRASFLCLQLIQPIL